MVNMGYCRFRNTNQALIECIDSLEENDYDIEQMIEETVSVEEKRAIKRFLQLCVEVAESVEDYDLLGDD